MSGKAVGTNWEGSWARYLGGGGQREGRALLVPRRGPYPLTLSRGFRGDS